MEIPTTCEELCRKHEEENIGWQATRQDAWNGAIEAAIATVGNDAELVKRLRKLQPHSYHLGVRFTRRHEFRWASWKARGYTGNP
jgi:hypothetical protein